MGFPTTPREETRVHLTTELSDALAEDQREEKGERILAGVLQVQRANALWGEALVRRVGIVI
jgi:hypothetical protein